MAAGNKPFPSALGRPCENSPSQVKILSCKSTLETGKEEQLPGAALQGAPGPRGSLCPIPHHIMVQVPCRLLLPTAEPSSSQQQHEDQPRGTVHSFSSRECLLVPMYPAGTEGAHMGSNEFETRRDRRVHPSLPARQLVGEHSRAHTCEHVRQHVSLCQTGKTSPKSPKLGTEVPEESSAVSSVGGTASHCNEAHSSSQPKLKAATK